MTATGATKQSSSGARHFPAHRSIVYRCGRPWLSSCPGGRLRRVLPLSLLVFGFQLAHVIEVLLVRVELMLDGGVHGFGGALPLQNGCQFTYREPVPRAVDGDGNTRALPR